MMMLPQMPQSTTISLIALLVSLGTTFVTYIRTYKQDIHDKRKELRELLEKLISIPRERLEKMKQYEGDAGLLSSFGQMYNQEGTLLSWQAAELASALPMRLVSATEYLSISMALRSAYNLVDAQRFAVLAKKRATGFNDRIAAMRMEASLQYSMGHPDAGRTLYQQALGIFEDNPAFAGYDGYTQTTTHVETELQWAGDEFAVGAGLLETQHLDRAQALVDSLPYSPGAESYRMRIAENRAFGMRRRAGAGGGRMQTDGTPGHAPTGGQQPPSQALQEQHEGGSVAKT